MRFLLYLAVLATLSRGYATPLHKNNSLPGNGHHLSRRWYGVQAITSTTDTDQDKIPKIYPWPTTCTSPYVQPVRYCFKDTRSANNLKDVVDGANAMWGQATKLTALKIELAGGCGGDPEVLCSGDRLTDERDALVIFDEMENNDATWNTGPEYQTTTKVCYRYSDKNIPYRHTLKIRDYGAGISNGDKADAIRSMAHELGHAMGLQHEHQRPDRDDYLRFRCRYLDGHDAAQIMAQEDPN